MFFSPRDRSLSSELIIYGGDCVSFIAFAWCNGKGKGGGHRGAMVCSNTPVMLQEGVF